MRLVCFHRHQLKDARAVYHYKVMISRKILVATGYVRRALVHAKFPRFFSWRFEFFRNLTEIENLSDQFSCCVKTDVGSENEQFCE